MTDRELLELVAQKVNGIDQRLTSVEEKISSVEHNMATKDELNRVHETMTGKLVQIQENMVTRDDLNRAIAESQKDILAMLQHVEKKLDNHTEQMEAKFEVLNDRLFNQEAQLRLLKKEAQ